MIRSQLLYPVELQTLSEERLRELLTLPINKASASNLRGMTIEPKDASFDVDVS